MLTRIQELVPDIELQDPFYKCKYVQDIWQFGDSFIVVSSLHVSYLHPGGMSERQITRKDSLPNAISDLISQLIKPMKPLKDNEASPASRRASLSCDV